MTAVLVAVTGPVPAGATPCPNVGNPVAHRMLVNGVTYEKYVCRDVPRRIHVLRVDPAANVTLDVALASPRLPGYARTSQMIARLGGIAGVNGDFGLEPGRPAHVFMRDGDLKQTTVLGIWGRGFALADDESTAYFGKTFTDIVATQLDGGAAIEVRRWNQGPPRASRVVGFSPVGGRLERPPKRGCSARLLPVGPRSFGPGEANVVRRFVVDVVKCTRNKAVAVRYGVVLSARRNGAGASAVTSLEVGELVEVSWSVRWPRVLDVIGGSTVLLENGAPAIERCKDAYLCARAHPRTGVGVTADGTILMVVVDGRSEISRGVDLARFTRIFSDLGATDALNLDGGGSSTMVFGGKIMNRPSDGAERPVTSALVVIPEFGTDAPEGAVAGSQAFPDTAAEQAARAALRDPGSTGGLLDWLDRRGELDPALRPELARFRAAWETRG